MTIDGETTQKKKIYFISGLGADRTVFDHLDLSFCQPVFLDWIKPLQKESLEHYALRLAEAIEEDDATIVALSMGGMMASEIVKAHPSMKAIIISSVRTSAQFPAYARFMIKYLPAYKLTTRWIVKIIFPLSCWYLGAETKDDKKLLWKVMNRTDIPFLKWCIGAIGGWKLNTSQPNIIHIHGTADRILPYHLVQPDATIKDAGHLMIRNRAGEISELLRKLC